MRKLLLAAVAVLGLSGSGNAAVITNFGADPSSAAGSFNHSLGSLVGGFSDQYTFELTHTLNLTIGSATNVFPVSTDFISGFSGSIYNAGADALPGGTGVNADTLVLGPLGATPCAAAPTICQGFSGSAILAAGDYYLQIDGSAGGTSGYGGNLATVGLAETPLPAAVWLFLSGLGALFGFQRWGKNKADAALAPA